MDIPKDVLIYKVLPFLDFRDLNAFETTCKEFYGNLNQMWFDLLENRCKITFTRIKDKSLVIPFSKRIYHKQNEKGWRQKYIYFMPVKRDGKNHSELLGCYSRELGCGQQAFLTVATPFVRAYKLFYCFEENNKVDEECLRKDSCRCEDCLIKMFRIITNE